MPYCIIGVQGRCSCTNNTCTGPSAGFQPANAPAVATEWRTSSHSGGDNGSQCVQVHQSLNQLRDSKNPHGPTLLVNVPALIKLVTQPNA